MVSVSQDSARPTSCVGVALSGPRVSFLDHALTEGHSGPPDAEWIAPRHVCHGLVAGHGRGVGSGPSLRARRRDCRCLFRFVQGGSSPGVGRRHCRIGSGSLDVRRSQVLRIGCLFQGHLYRFVQVDSWPAVGLSHHRIGSGHLDGRRSGVQRIGCLFQGHLYRFVQVDSWPAVGRRHCRTGSGSLDGRRSRVLRTGCPFQIHLCRLVRLDSWRDVGRRHCRIGSSSLDGRRSRVQRIGCPFQIHLCRSVPVGSWPGVGQSHYRTGSVALGGRRPCGLRILLSPGACPDESTALVRFPCRYRWTRPSSRSRPGTWLSEELPVSVSLSSLSLSEIGSFPVTQAWKRFRRPMLESTFCCAPLGSNRRSSASLSDGLH
jgi:hypothetical protein